MVWDSYVNVKLMFETEGISRVQLVEFDCEKENEMDVVRKSPEKLRDKKQRS